MQTCLSDRELTTPDGTVYLRVDAVADKDRRCSGCAGDTAHVSEKPTTARMQVCRGIHELHTRDHGQHKLCCFDISNHVPKVWIRKDDPESLADYVAAKLES